MLATRGRVFTQAEELLTQYKRLRQDYQLMKAGKPTSAEIMFKDFPNWTSKDTEKYHATIERDMARFGLHMTGIMMAAINSEDASQLFEIAKAIESLKSFKQSGDHYRAWILCLKRVYSSMGETLPIRQLAKIIGWPESKSDDGFARLRRLCKELNCPLAIKTNKRKSPAKKSWSKQDK